MILNLLDVIKELQATSTHARVRAYVRQRKRERKSQNERVWEGGKRERQKERDM